MTNLLFRVIIRRTSFLFIIILLIPSWLAVCWGQQFSYQPDKKITGKAYYADPALSPDGSTIAFSSGGDIWTVAATGGDARLLIAHPAFESRPVYSPDGRYLAFNSNRTGNGDVYMLEIASGDLHRLTYDDANDEVSSWSPDGKYVYFSTSSHDINAMRDVYRVRASGGTAMAVTDNRYVSEFWPMPSPDGKTMAFTARGVASGQWWRNGHSHLDESEIWLWKEGKVPSYEKLVGRGAKNLWPMWSKDGNSIYYVSDSGGTSNLWTKPLHEKPKQLTRFTKGRVLWPSISHNASLIVFERDFAIWKYDISTGTAAMVDIRRIGVPAPTVMDNRRTDGFRDLEISPDGKKLAFVARGEVFVAAASGGDAFRATFTGASQSQLNWAAGSNAICYVSDRDETTHLYEYNFITNKETRLTSNAKDDASPVYAPDGKTLAFIRDNKELMLLDRGTGKETVLSHGYIGRGVTNGPLMKWSPDGKWLAYTESGTKGFRNATVIPVTGGSPQPVSFLANSFGGTIAWGDDGKYLLFSTSQRTETRNLARVELVPRKPQFSEDKLQRLFIEQTTSPSTPVQPGEPAFTKNTTPPADSAARKAAARESKKTSGTTTEVVMEGIHERTSLLPMNGADINDIAVGRDGMLLLNATIGEQTNLYTYSIDPVRGTSDGLKPLTSTAGGKSDAQFSADGKEVFFLSQGTIQSVSLDSKVVRPIPVRAEMETEFEKERLEMFRQAWTVLKKNYADEAMNGVDWDAVYRTYEPMVAGAATPDEVRRILNLMVGELNSSHSGVAGGGTAPTVTGRLGLYFNRNDYDERGVFKIREIIYGGPAWLAGSVHVGDYLISIDGKKLTASDNIDQLLENKSGRKITLAIMPGTKSAQPDSKKDSSISATVQPITLAVEKALLYRQWVKEERAYVNKLSNGRLGYVHMNDMGQQSLEQLYVDLDVENQGKEGVVVDVRNNNGGFVNAYALDVLARKPYLTMTPRGLPAAPARAQLGQRALEIPTILLTNQHSLSDAEDFAEGYRTLGLGKIVGEPTGGWIIYTSSITLIDGSSVRLPFIKVTDHEGKNMELHPRPVDIAISNPLGAPAGSDAQAETAVKELLKELDEAKRSH